MRNRWQFYLKFRAMKDGYERELDGYSDKINKDYDFDVIVKLINWPEVILLVESYEFPY
jgi:hypothetical protein